METYEARLNRNSEWALWEGSLHFEERSAVFKTLDKVAAALTRLGVPFAVYGDLAMFRHGFRRFTEIVQLLVTEDAPRSIHNGLV